MTHPSKLLSLNWCSSSLVLEELEGFPHPFRKLCAPGRSHEIIHEDAEANDNDGCHKNGNCDRNELPTQVGDPTQLQQLPQKKHKQRCDDGPLFHLALRSISERLKLQVQDQGGQLH